MNIPKDATSAPHLRWLLGLPVLAALLYLGLAASHQHAQWRQTLREFRGDAFVGSAPNTAMADALRERRNFLLHPHQPLSLAESSQLVGFINSPVDEQSQSEALDVLSLAQRTKELPPGQAQKAKEATLLVLSRSPAPMVRLEGARLLGHLGGSGSVAALTLLHDDPDPKIREAAAEALARVQVQARVAL